MIDTFTVSFFGHRTIDNPLLIERRLEVLIRKLLSEKGYIEFLVGRDGEFDQIVSSTIRRCKRTVRNDNSTHVWVLPYVTSEYVNNETNFRDYYDENDIWFPSPIISIIGIAICIVADVANKRNRDA